MTRESSDRTRALRHEIVRTGDPRTHAWRAAWDTPMRPILATAIVAAVCGGLAGGAVVLATDDDSAATAAPASAATTAPAPTGKALNAAEIYRRDAPAVVVITATT